MSVQPWPAPAKLNLFLHVLRRRAERLEGVRQGVEPDAPRQADDPPHGMTAGAVPLAATLAALGGTVGAKAGRKFVLISCAGQEEDAHPLAGFLLFLRLDSFRRKEKKDNNAGYCDKGTEREE